MVKKDANQIRHQSPSRVIIDCSDEKEVNTDGIIEWLKKYPRRSNDIHVYVPSFSNHVELPKFRSTLLGLGCTVTAIKTQPLAIYCTENT